MFKVRPVDQLDPNLATSELRTDTCKQMAQNTPTSEVGDKMTRWLDIPEMKLIFIFLAKQVLYCVTLETYK